MKEPYMVCSQYYEPYEVTPLLKKSSKHLSFFYLNISSRPFHIQELSTLITEHNLSFDCLRITESLLKLHKNPIGSIHLLGYNIE